ncbi:hypothetical protein SESBI_43062 [Sesbania bispinosa]|nr:hypothetical protein SESBI_43062 [Sesbania bispinosa]
MSERPSPVVVEDDTLERNELVNPSGVVNVDGGTFSWVDPFVLKHTSVLLSPESLISVKEGELYALEMLDIKLLRLFLPVSCNVLIEKEGDAGTLQPYIVEMSNRNESFVPQMNAKAMKAFSKASKRKQASQASEPVIVVDTENEVSSSTISDKLVSKKVCHNKDLSSSSAQSTLNAENPQTSSANRTLVVAPTPPKWWHWFQGYEGKPGSEITSIFYRRLPTEQLIQSHLCKADDRVRIQKVGMLITTKMVQTFAAQTAFLGHALESGVGLLEKELKEKIQQLKDQEEEIARAREISSELETLQEKFQNISLEKEKLEGDLTDLKKEKEKSDNLLEEKTKLLKAAEESLVAEQKGRKEELNQLKAEITFQYEQGFDKAIGQVKFLYPELNVEEVGAFKEIQDGKLIEILDDEE